MKTVMKSLRQPQSKLTLLVQTSVIVSVLFAGVAQAAPSKSELARNQAALQAELSALKKQMRQMGGVSPEVVMNLLERVEQLQASNAQLMGRVEKQERDIERLVERQRAMYADLDQRINHASQASGNASDSEGDADLETSVNSASELVSQMSGITSTDSASGGASDASKPEANKPTTSAQSNDDSGKEREVYESAFNALRKGSHAQAIKRFDDYLKKHPKGRYADNAQYWKGEAHYVSRQFSKAKVNFQRVMDAYPNSNKLGDATLKLGYTFYELKDFKSARKVLSKVVKRFPNSKVSSLAEKRLLLMNKEGR